MGNCCIYFRLRHFQDQYYKKSKDDPEDRCQELLRDWVEDKHDDTPKTWFTLLNTIAEDPRFIRSTEKILENLKKKYAS